MNFRPHFQDTLLAASVRDFMLVMHLLQDVEANCADYRAKRITCTDAMPGMEVTVKWGK